MSRPSFIGIALLLFAYGCATTPPSSPFTLSEQFHTTVKTIALAPVTLPETIENPEEVSSRFESLITAELRKQGFTVITSSDVMEIWREIAKQEGGCFDPMTGVLDQEKQKTIRTRTIHAVHSRLKPDAVLYPGIVISTVTFMYAKAQWDGTAEPIRTGPHTSRDELVHALLYQNITSGYISALSLQIVIEDRNEKELYRTQGGIQLMSKLLGTEFIPVPQNELLADSALNAKAVAMTLGPLAKKRPSDSGAQP